MVKKLTILSLVFAVLLSCFAGCGANRKEDSTQPQQSAGYVQEEISVPLDEGYSQDMVMLPDGRLWMAVNSTDEKSTVLLTSNEARTEWEKTEALPDEVLASGGVWSVTLSDLGEMYVITCKGDGEETPRTFRYWYQAPGEAIKEVTLHAADMEFDEHTMMFEAEFITKGKVLQRGEDSSMREIDLTTGEIGENKDDKKFRPFHIQKAGDTVYLTGYDSVAMYRDGEIQMPESPAEKQISAEQKANEGNSNSKLTFWVSPDEYLFFTTREGLYSCVPGGTITEQLISGERSVFGDPGFHAISLVGAPDDSFYVFGGLTSPKLYHYVYAPEITTGGSESLTIYMLHGEGGTYTQENMEKIVNQFGIANPSVDIHLEFGIEEDNAITEADAIRTLNTRILSGEGPDILYLDGMNIDTFLDKNVLVDISSVLAESGPLVDAVTRCYEEDGKVCALPTAFAIPAIYGPKTVISQIHDLDSLLEAAENRDASVYESVSGNLFAVYMGDNLYDACSPAWFREDGTLDGEKLEEFYDAMARLFAMDQEYRAPYSDFLEEVAAEGGVEPFTQHYSGFLGGMDAMEKKYFSYGSLNGMDAWSNTLAGDQNFEGNEVLPLNLQASGVFIPRRILGVLSGTKNQSAAEKFIRFVLSPEIQVDSGYVGFPVNCSGLDQVISEDRTTTVSMSIGDIRAEALWPDRERRQMLNGWVSQLTTPASVNWMIRDMILKQLAPCCSGEITAKEAADAAIKALNLYLAE